MLRDFLREDVLLVDDPSEDVVFLPDVPPVDDPLEDVVFLLPEVPPDDEPLEDVVFLPDVPPEDVAPEVVVFLLFVLLLPVVGFLREDVDDVLPEVLPEPVLEPVVPVVAPASGITVSFPESEITFILTCLLPFLTRNPCVAGAVVWVLTASVFRLMSRRSTATTPPAPAMPPTREQQSARTTIFAAVPLVFFGGSVL